MTSIILHPKIPSTLYQAALMQVPSAPKARDSLRLWPKQCVFLCPKNWEPVDHLQRSLGPSGPETPKKTEKSLPGPPAPGPSESLEKVLKKSFGTFSRLFSDSPDFFETFSRLSGGQLRKRRHCTGVKIPKIGKRGFRGQKTPISHRLRQGRFESKNPHFSTGLHKENGDFSTQSALFWGDGKWEFFDPETLFSRFWGFWPLYSADAFAILNVIF